MDETIAVLPFQDLSPGKDQGHLAEGLAEELIAALGEVAGLRVTARAISFQLKGSALDARAIGERLAVASVVKGALRKVGDQLLVTVQVVEAATGRSRFSHRFEGPASEVFRIEEEIVAAVLGALRGEAHAAQAAPRPLPHTGVGAYEHFLRGRQLLRHQDERFLTQAEAALRLAVELDPKFAPAWAALALVHAQRVEWYGGGESVREAADQAGEAAVRLGPELSESHLARGVVLAMRRDYAGAEREYQEAVGRNPRSFDAHYHWARACTALGKSEVAAELFQKAASLQPEDFQALILSVIPLKRLGRTDAAAEAQREGIRRAERLLEWNPDNTRALSLGGCALAEAGDRERALDWCRRAVKVAPNDVGVNYNAGCLFAKLEMADDALACLERTFGRGFGKRDWVEHDSDWNLLRGHPRFQELLAKLP